MQKITVDKRTFTKQKEFVDFAGKVKKTWDQCNDQLDIVRDLGIGEIFGDAFKAEIKAGQSSQIDYQLLAQNIANHFGVGCSVTEATAFVKNSKIKKPSRHKVTFSTTK